MVIFDFDQTLVDTSPLEHLRRPGRWGTFNQEARVLEPYEGVSELLVELSVAGQQLGIVTSSPDMVPRGFIARYASPVDCVVGYHDVRQRKPHPVGLQLALERCGATSAGSYHVGDRAQDTEAARRASVSAVGAGWDTHELELLRGSSPDVICMSVAELRTFLMTAIA